MIDAILSRLARRQEGYACGHTTRRVRGSLGVQGGVVRASPWTMVNEKRTMGSLNVVLWTQTRLWRREHNVPLYLSVAGCTMLNNCSHSTSFQNPHQLFLHPRFRHVKLPSNHFQRLPTLQHPYDLLLSHLLSGSPKFNYSERSKSR